MNGGNYIRTAFALPSNSSPSGDAMVVDDPWRRIAEARLANVMANRSAWNQMTKTLRRLGQSEFDPNNYDSGVSSDTTPPPTDYTDPNTFDTSYFDSVANNLTSPADYPNTPTPDFLVPDGWDPSVWNALPQDVQDAILAPVATVDAPITDTLYNPYLDPSTPQYACLHDVMACPGGLQQQPANTPKPAGPQSAAQSLTPQSKPSSQQSQQPQCPQGSQLVNTINGMKCVNPQTGQTSYPTAPNTTLGINNSTLVTLGFILAGGALLVWAAD